MAKQDTIIFSYEPKVEGILNGKDLGVVLLDNFDYGHNIGNLETGQVMANIFPKQGTSVYGRLLKVKSYSGVVKKLHAESSGFYAHHIKGDLLSPVNSDLSELLENSSVVYFASKDFIAKQSQKHQVVERDPRWALATPMDEDTRSMIDSHARAMGLPQEYLDKLMSVIYGEDVRSYGPETSTDLLGIIAAKKGALPVQIPEVVRERLDVIKGDFVRISYEGNNVVLQVLEAELGTTPSKDKESKLYIGAKAYAALGIPKEFDKTKGKDVRLKEVDLTVQKVILDKDVIVVESLNYTKPQVIPMETQVLGEEPPIEVEEAPVVEAPVEAEESPSEDLSKTEVLTQEIVELGEKVDDLLDRAKPDESYVPPQGSDAGEEAAEVPHTEQPGIPNSDLISMIKGLGSRNEKQNKATSDKLDAIASRYDHGKAEVDKRFESLAKELKDAKSNYLDPASLEPEPTPPPTPELPETADAPTSESSDLEQVVGEEVKENPFWAAAKSIWGAGCYAGNGVLEGFGWFGEKIERGVLAVPELVRGPKTIKIDHCYDDGALALENQVGLSPNYMKVLNVEEGDHVELANKDDKLSAIVVKAPGNLIDGIEKAEFPDKVILLPQNYRKILGFGGEEGDQPDEQRSSSRTDLLSWKEVYVGKATIKKVKQ